MNLILTGLFVWRVMNSFLGQGTDMTPQVLGNRDLAQVIASPTTNTPRSQAQNAAETRRSQILQKRERAALSATTSLAQIKDQLTAISDETKRRKIESVCTRFEAVTHKYTSTFTDSLTRLEFIMLKLDTRLTNAGNQASQCVPNVEAARLAVETAQTTISSQAENIYVCSNTDESTLRTTLTDTKTLLRTDLKNSHTALENAKAALQGVVTCLKEVESNALNPDA